jgi:hypothetical protein
MTDREGLKSTISSGHVRARAWADRRSWVNTARLMGKVRRSSMKIIILDKKDYSSRKMAWNFPK